jgi:hypothetical protein
MDSVRDGLRRDTIERVLALTPRERIDLAFSLGEDDLRLFMQTHRLDRPSAIARLRAQRQAGRSHSVASQFGPQPCDSSS